MRSSNGFKVMDRRSWQSKKILDLLGSRLRFSRVYIVNCCSPSDPGSNPGRAKLLAPTAPLPLDQNECIAPHLKISLLPTWSQRIRVLALLLGHFMNTQINLISYHKMRIVPVSLRLTVYEIWQCSADVLCMA